MCTPAHGRPIFAPTTLPTKQKNLTCVTGHKQNKSLFKSSSYTNKCFTVSTARTPLPRGSFNSKWQRTLLSHGSVSHTNHGTNPPPTQPTHTFITFSLHKPKILTGKQFMTEQSLANSYVFSIRSPPKKKSTTVKMQENKHKTHQNRCGLSSHKIPVRSRPGKLCFSTVISTFSLFFLLVYHRSFSRVFSSVLSLRSLLQRH